MEVARLRYGAYVQEQGKNYPEANHEAKLLSDPLDATGETIYVAEGEAVLGTVRANWFDCETTYARYGKTFQIDEFDRVPRAQISMCSRLAVIAHRRNAVIRRLLFNAIYEQGLKRRTRLSFVTCAPSLLRMFQRYGFREYAAPIHDPVAQTLHRMLLVLDDVLYLSSIGSPFYRIAVNAGVSIADRAEFAHLFFEGPRNVRNNHPEPAAVSP